MTALPSPTHEQLVEAGAVRLRSNTREPDMFDVEHACLAVANFAQFYRDCPQHPANRDHLDTRMKLYREALAKLRDLLEVE